MGDVTRQDDIAFGAAEDRRAENRAALAQWHAEWLASFGHDPACACDNCRVRRVAREDAAKAEHARLREMLEYFSHDPLTCSCETCVERRAECAVDAAVEAEHDPDDVEDLSESDPDDKGDDNDE